MNTLKLFAVAGALALSGGAASAATIPDFSFESPAGEAGFDYRPSVDGVVFTGDAGVSSGSSFDAAPDGVQNAFLQSTADSGARIDISVTGLTAGDVYSFSYFDDQRGGFGVNAYTVSFNGALLASFSPEASGWTARTTGTFTAGDTFGTLTFESPVLGYDNDAGIDDITLNDTTAAGGAGVPEPTAWALMLVGFGGIGATLRRRRRAVAAAS